MLKGGLILDINKYDDLVQCILNALQYKVCKVLLYGPAAENASHEGEIDIAVLTPYKISEDQEERLSDAVSDLNNKHCGRYSVIDIDITAFTKKRSDFPLYQEIAQTGMVLWTK